MDEATFDRAAREAAGAPRRAAIRGLAGLAALGALAAGRGGEAAAGDTGKGRKDTASAAAKKRKRAAKGTLVRVEYVESDPVTVPAGNSRTATATCPEPGRKEDVFVLGGGVNLRNEILIPTRWQAFADRYETDASNNSDGDQTFTAQAICGYVRR